MPLNSKFYQIYSQLNLINCIFLHYVSLNIHSHLFFSNLLYMPLGGKWQTILKVTLNSKLCKTYIHLKVIFGVFLPYNSKLTFH